MPTCERCGEHVSEGFARVMGDRDNCVHACPSCAENAVGEAAAGFESQKLTGVSKRL